MRYRLIETLNRIEHGMNKAKSPLELKRERLGQNPKGLTRI